MFVCRETERSTKLATVYRSVEGPELEVEGVVDLYMSPDTKMAMHMVRLDVEDRYSLVRDVCPARRAEDGYILESPVVEGVLELESLAQQLAWSSNCRRLRY